MENDFVLYDSSRVQSVMVWKPWKQELDAHGHIASEWQKEESGAC